MHNSTDIFSISGTEEFHHICLNTFHYQYQFNPVYREFCDLLKVQPASVSSIEQIPFLPIEFFKSKRIITEGRTEEIVFSSSGTTGEHRSRHYLAEKAIYESSFRKGFEICYGDIKDYVVLALLPSYLERTGSSLIYMVQDLIIRSKHEESGFYLQDHQALINQLETLVKRQQKILLIGVSFALLDLAQICPFPLQNTTVMETGGMKGRRKEMIREELHDILREGFGVNHIHSEYGMTELLSQAYATSSGIFECPPWMKLIIRDPEDPANLLAPGKSGGINVIDLANLYSCSFLATQDLGKQVAPGKTEILGRFDNSDVRGCNLLVF